MKECGWCQKEGGVEGKLLYPLSSDWQESDKVPHHPRLHHRKHWELISYQESAQESWIMDVRLCILQLYFQIATEFLWQMAEITTGTGCEGLIASCIKQQTHKHTLLPREKPAPMCACGAE